jgi:hypothetical protein
MVSGEPVVGVHGLRTFRLSEDGHLIPVTTFSDDWQGGICIARCLHEPAHQPPVDDCECGIYSFRDLASLHQQYDTSLDVVAVIALEGQVVEGERGWRAQAARVVALWLGPIGIPAALAEQARTNHPLVRFFDDLADMLAAYPDVAQEAAHARRPDPDDEDLPVDLIRYLWEQLKYTFRLQRLRQRLRTLQTEDAPVSRTYPGRQCVTGPLFPAGHAPAGRNGHAR